MRDDISRWVGDGITVALIGNGTAAFAQAFQEDFAFEGQLFIDPELVSYRAAGLRRGAAAIASPSLFADSARALRAGARQAGVQGDPWQLGGAFVIDQAGDLRLASRSETAGDHVAASEVDAALKENAPVIVESRERSPLARVANATRSLLDVSPVGSFDRIGFARHALGFNAEDLEVDLYGQRALVTGANSGIGYETALALADLGANVVLICRNAERGESALASIRETTGNRQVELCVADLSNLADVERAAAELAKEPIDILVHNAGILPDDRIESPEGLELTFATHIAGPHLLTSILRPALEEGGARVIWVSSGGMLTSRLELNDAQWVEREYDGVKAYAETKRAQVVMSEQWAEEFAGTDVTVNSMHPGWADTPSVASSLPRFHRVTEAILRTPEEGADTVVWLAASPAASDVSGRFFFDRTPARTHWVPTTREREADRRAYWEFCGGAEPNRTTSFGLAADEFASD